MFHRPRPRSGFTIQRDADPEAKGFWDFRSVVRQARPQENTGEPVRLQSSRSFNLNYFFQFATVSSFIGNKWHSCMFKSTRPRRLLWPTLRLALLGAAIAGAYGAVHDQVSYTISPEY